MKRFLGKILLGMFIIVSLVVLMVVGVIVFDSLFPRQQVTDYTNVSYPGPDGETLFAYLVQPEGIGPFPAILFVHEFFGINEDVVKKADLLAKQGYLVLLVDAYRGKTTPVIPRAIWLVVSTPQEEIHTDIDMGYRYLAGLPQVDTDRIGALGFCFGGTQVMYLGTRNPDLVALAIFYGSGPITDPTQLGVMGTNGPVLGIYGERDNSIPIKKVRDFESAMQARGVQNQVIIYPGVGHAFVNTDTLAQPGAAQDAWNQMLEFFNQTLGN